MSFWKRCLVLLLAVVAITVFIDLVLHYAFGFSLPAYVSGIIGGMTAVPVWDFLKRTKPR